MIIKALVLVTLSMLAVIHLSPWVKQWQVGVEVAAVQQLAEDYHVRLTCPWGACYLPVLGRLFSPSLPSPPTGRNPSEVWFAVPVAGPMMAPGQRERDLHRVNLYRNKLERTNIPVSAQLQRLP